MSAINPSEKHYTSTNILRLFRLGITAQALNKAAKEKRIPEAKKMMRGRVPTRYWELDDLPKIGGIFGSFKKPHKTEIIASYIPKGGVGKTTWTLNFSRMLALHGMKTLVIGADFQCNLSKSFGVNYDSDELPLSLYDALLKNANINDVISNTDLPTLDVITESPELALLDREIFKEFQREKLLTKALKPVINSYDVIIIDCPPQWNELVTNALVLADHIISPVSADGESFHSMKMFIPALESFIDKSGHSFETIKFIPNNINVRTKYSTSFQKKFFDSYPDLFTISYIRESISVKEAITSGISTIEYDPKSISSEDFYTAAIEVWNEITGSVQ